MARLATRGGLRALLFVLVLLPLWSSYLVRIYAWQLDPRAGRDPQLVARRKLGLPAASMGYTNTAMWIVFSYIWLPFMILPIYAALERIPDSLLEASRDLGATELDDVPARHPAAGAAGHRRRLDLHVLADARRLHHAVARRRSESTSSATSSTATCSAWPTTCRSRRLMPSVPLIVMAIYLVLAERLGAFEALWWRRAQLGLAAGLGGPRRAVPLRLPS